MSIHPEHPFHSDGLRISGSLGPVKIAEDVILPSASVFQSNSISSVYAPVTFVDLKQIGASGEGTVLPVDIERFQDPLLPQDSGKSDPFAFFVEFLSTYEDRAKKEGADSLRKAETAKVLRAASQEQIRPQSSSGTGTRPGNWKDLVKNMQTVTGAFEEKCVSFLGANGWDVRAATKSFFSGGDAQRQATVVFELPGGKVASESFSPTSTGWDLQTKAYQLITEKDREFVMTLPRGISLTEGDYTKSLTSLGITGTGNKIKVKYT